MNKERSGHAAVPAAGKRAILVVSFGTSYNESRAVTIEAIERQIAEQFPAWEMRRAFTSQTIIRKLAKRDGLVIDNVGQALARLYEEGFATVLVQPTHIMPGYEYDDIVSAVRAYEDKFETIAMGRALLSGSEDYNSVIAALRSRIPELGAEDTAVVLMGHGTEHLANAVYSELARRLHVGGYRNAFIGTVEGFPTINEVRAELRERDVSRAVLYPFMIVAGDHAVNDMAGEEPESWKNLIENDGIKVECRLEGLGENPAMRDIIIQHLRALMASVSA